MPVSRRRDHGAPDLVMHLSVPAHGGLRVIASEVAARVAEHLGAAATRAETIGALVERLAAGLVSDGAPENGMISFEFRESDGELVVAGRCAGKATEVRHQLSA